MKPSFDLDKIKYSTDKPTWEKAVGLVKKGKVTKFEELADGFGATVLGTSPYRVIVSAKHFDRGDCECYLGQKEILCKHMVAVAIYAVKNGQELSESDIKQGNDVVFSGQKGNLSETDLEAVKQAISGALKYIKAYTGPSKTWFAYQDSLNEGCNRLASIVAKLPAGPESSELLVDLLLKLDKKLTRGGVDDSDGTVGDFITDSVQVLEQFAAADSRCIEAFKELCDAETCFGWEEPLNQIYSSHNNKGG